jgi:hypothetical protein
VQPELADPTVDSDRDGVMDTSRVGVDGRFVPDKVRRLGAALPSDARRAEYEFVSTYEKNPMKMAKAYTERTIQKSAELSQKLGKHIPPTFETDAVKMMHETYRASDPAKGRLNIALHQTANAAAKLAFQDYIENVVAKAPPEKRVILVTQGGCAAGKSTALMKTLPNVMSDVAAVWDAAGEQNSTELPWIGELCRKHGITAKVVYVDTDPTVSFPRVISRALGDPASGKKPEGRVVSRLLFSESYSLGAKNFDAFMKRNKATPNFQFHVLTTRTPDGSPKLVSNLPAEAFMSTEDIDAMAKKYVRDRSRTLPPVVLDALVQADRVFKRHQEMRP